LRGRIEVGEAGLLRRAGGLVAVSASPTLPSPAGGGGDVGWIA
jgi:hypothetical protein